MMNDQIFNEVKKIVPSKPGCYIYYNKFDEIIYIGKAKNLLKRMSSYFNRSNNLKTTKLVNDITRFEYILTNNEKEALILENNLIKKNTPKYNILLKDDKSYPFILLTQEKYPRLLSVKNTKIKGQYFGPFPSSSFVNEIVELLNKKIPLRKCRKLPKTECIYYHIKQCYAPCILKVDDNDTNEYIKTIKNYLSGNYTKLSSLIEKEMYKKSDALDFENAQKFKLLSEQLHNFKVQQSIEIAKHIDIDVYAFYNDDSWISISIVSVRSGKVNNISTGLTAHDGDLGDTIVSFLYDYYQNKNIPEKFLIDNEEIVKKITSLFINDVQNDHLNYYKNLLDLAQNNAREYFKNNVDTITKKMLSDKVDGFTKLKELTNNNLKLIEMYDISHTGGDNQVAGKVVFENGVKNPKLYRKYKIKSAKKADDYGSIREVIERRITKLIKDEEIFPNMIIVDGGKGQVSSALSVLKQYEIDNKIILIGLAKDDFHTTRAIINKNLDEMPLSKNDPLYNFFYKIQEEVHRFAINYHRNLKNKSLFSSKLDNINGLGVKRKRLLLEKFKTIDNIKKLDVKDITKLSIPIKVAQEILKVLNKPND